MNTEVERKEENAAPPFPVPAVLRDLLTGLLDLQFTSLIAKRMLPSVYLVLIVGLGIFSMAVVVEAFGRSIGQGLFNLFIVAPAYFIAGAVLIRVTLELIYAVFHIAENMEDLTLWTQSITSLDGFRDALRALLPKSERRDAK